MYFIDIETVPAFKTLSAAPERVKDLFETRFNSEMEKALRDGVSDLVAHEEYLYQTKAGLYAEFGKIVCVCLGRIRDGELHVRTLCSRYENILLEKLSEIIDGGRAVIIPLCAHNGKEFDFPFLMRRYLINKQPIPKVLRTFNLKPWDTELHDTMELWSGTQWKHRVSLDLLCNCLGIESPKQGEVTGANLAEVYYSMFEAEDAHPFDKETEVLNLISKYCQGDIIALADVYSAINGTPAPEKIIILESK